MAWSVELGQDVGLRELLTCGEAGQRAFALLPLRVLVPVVDLEHPSARVRVCVCARVRVCACVYVCVWGG